jgi:hypothetical protein
MLTHMLRHSTCGFALPNAGHDTRSLQGYLGHRNIQHTVRYTELAPGRLSSFACRASVGLTREYRYGSACQVASRTTLARVSALARQARQGGGKQRGSGMVKA